MFFWVVVFPRQLFFFMEDLISFFPFTFVSFLGNNSFSLSFLFLIRDLHGFICDFPRQSPFREGLTCFFSYVSSLLGLTDFLLSFCSLLGIYVFRG